MPCTISHMCVVRWYTGMVSVTHKPFRNRNIEYFDFHFSRVLCATKMAHLRRLGIHRFHFSITISFDCFGFGCFCISLPLHVCTLFTLIHAYRFKFHLHLHFFFDVLFCRFVTLFNWTPLSLRN